MTRDARSRFLPLVLVAAMSMGTPGCHRNAPVWNGSWRLNQHKSTVPWPNFTVTILPDGEYQADNGTYSDRFRCDGRQYPMPSGNTISCVQRGALAIELATKKNGTTVSISHWEVSADGRTLTVKAGAVASRGSAKTVERVYARMSGSSGFAGAWKDVKGMETRPQLLVLTLNDRVLHYEFPERGQYADVRLDGSETAWRGSGVPPKVTVAVLPKGPDEFLTIRRFDGRITNQGSMRVSADGRTLVEEFWGPDRPDMRTVLTYEKQ